MLSYQQRVDLRWVEGKLQDKFLSTNQVSLRVVTLEVLLVFLTGEVKVTVLIPLA